jgi:hypothetical protein
MRARATADCAGTARSACALWSSRPVSRVAALWLSVKPGPPPTPTPPPPAHPRPPFLEWSTVAVRPALHLPQTALSCRFPHVYMLERASVEGPSVLIAVSGPCGVGACGVLASNLPVVWVPVVWMPVAWAGVPRGAVPPWRDAKCSQRGAHGIVCKLLCGGAVQLCEPSSLMPSCTCLCLHGVVCLVAVHPPPGPPPPPLAGKEVGTYLEVPALPPSTALGSNRSLWLYLACGVRCTGSSTFVHV